MEKALVSVIKIDYNSENLRNEVFAGVKKAMEEANWEKYILPGDSVCIKPNLCLDLLFPGAITSPWVLEGVILVLRKKIKKIYLVESDTWTTDVENGVRASGLLDICQKYNVKWINLLKNNFVKKKIQNNLALGEVVEIPDIISKSKLLTIPVLKTHGNSLISGAIKNQWGCLKKMRIDYHEKINEALVDLNRVLKPDFCVMDATIGSEGKGPKQGRPRICNLILAAADNVAMDTVAAKLMGINPESVEHLKLCAKYNTGISDFNNIKINGEDVENINFNFDYGGKSLLTAADLFLRKPFLKRLFYHTFLFKILIFLAKINYVFWQLFYGKRLRSKIIKSKYGEQWIG